MWQVGKVMDRTAGLILLNGGFYILGKGIMRGGPRLCAETAIFK